MILLSELNTTVSYDLKNTVETPITSGKFVEAANRAIDILLSMGNYSSIKRRKIITFLEGESDYDIETNLSIADFGQVYDIRPTDSEYLGEWEFKDEKKFAARKSQ